MHGICTRDFEKNERVYIDDNGRIYKKEPQTIEITYNMIDEEHEIVAEEIASILKNNNYRSVKGTEIINLEDSSNVCIKGIYGKIED
jgi:hypothetical protein